MRDKFDDMQVESEFHSDRSNITYPDDPDKMRDPNYLASLELFRERLKSKYHYRNLYVEVNNNPKNPYG
jgi:hypothetical protein